MSYKTGKLPAVERATDFLYEKYTVTNGGVVVPRNFGYGNAFTDWGMNGNDQWGDCVFAGGGHETELFNWLAAGAHYGQPSPVSITADNSLSDYGAVTGFTPTDPSTDQGTNVGTALAYRRAHGLIDANGVRHKIAAYVKLNPKDIKQLAEAIYLFDAVGIGFEFPNYAMDQFNANKWWSYKAGQPAPSDGHYVCAVGKHPGFISVISWGRRQYMTDQFYQAYNDEAYGIMSLESLNALTGTTIGGFDWSQLAADAKVLGVLSNDPTQPSAAARLLSSNTTDSLTLEQAAFERGFKAGWDARAA